MIDLTKRNSSLHARSGSVAFRRTLGRQALDFLKRRPKGIVEFCGSSHYQGGGRSVTNVAAASSRSSSVDDAERSPRPRRRFVRREDRGIVGGMCTARRKRTPLRGRRARSRGFPRHSGNSKMWCPYPTQPLERSLNERIASDRVPEDEDSKRSRPGVGPLRQPSHRRTRGATSPPG